MKRRLLSILLALALCLGLAPGGARAAGQACTHDQLDEDGRCSSCGTVFVATVTIGATTTPYETIERAWTAAKAGGIIALFTTTGPETDSPLVVEQNDNITLKWDGEAILASNISCNGGTLIVENGTIEGNISVTDGSVSIKGGIVPKITWEAATTTGNGHIALSGGTFRQLVGNKDHPVSDMLKPGYGIKKEGKFLEDDEINVTSLQDGPYIVECKHESKADNFTPSTDPDKKLTHGKVCSTCGETCDPVDCTIKKLLPRGEKHSAWCEVCDQTWVVPHEYSDWKAEKSDDSDEMAWTLTGKCACGVEENCYISQDDQSIQIQYGYSAYLHVYGIEESHSSLGIEFQWSVATDPNDSNGTVLKDENGDNLGTDGIYATGFGQDDPQVGKYYYTWKLVQTDSEKTIVSGKFALTVNPKPLNPSISVDDKHYDGLSLIHI